MGLLDELRDRYDLDIDYRERVSSGTRKAGGHIRKGLEWASEYEAPDYSFESDFGYTPPDFGEMGGGFDWGSTTPRRSKSKSTGGRRHAYRKRVDTSDHLKYVKHHDGGKKTVVRAERAGTRATGTSWVVNARSTPGGHERVGQFGTKEAARRAMTRWMNANPAGVRSRGRF